MSLDYSNNLVAYEELDPSKVEAEAEPDTLIMEEDIEAPEIEHFDDAIKLYLREIQKSKLLSADEEKELANRIAIGDQTARDKMIESNLRWVVKIAKRYVNRGIPFLDLIAEGNMGLIKAVDRFQVSRECRFSTYATWWIRQTIERSIAKHSRTVRLPVHISDDLNKMYRVTRELLNKTNREPTSKDIATEMGVDIAYVRRLKVLYKRTYSIERPIGEDGDFTLLDTIEDTSTVPVAELIENVDKYEAIKTVMETLSDNERNILTLRFGLDDKEPQALEPIGQIYGVTRERIRQIEANALAKLRNILREDIAGIT